MKIKKEKDKKDVRKEILESAIASFRIEGIHIPKQTALNTLKKIEISLGK